MSNPILKTRSIPTEFWELRNKGEQDLYLQAALYTVRKAKQITHRKIMRWCCDSKQKSQNSGESRLAHIDNRTSSKLPLLKVVQDNSPEKP